jgi:hypothetical protein
MQNVMSPEMAKYGIDANLLASIPEINDVLRRHGLEGKVALQIIHQHFMIADDEVLYESHNAEKRELTFSPVKRDSQSPADVFVSSWNPATGKSITRCPRTHSCHQSLD